MLGSWKQNRSKSLDVELQGAPHAQVISSAQRSPPRQTSLSQKLKSLLPALQTPLAILMGAGIIAGTTYALVKRVQHLIAHAQVTSDPSVWVRKASDDGYGACYNGCDDCHDLSFALRACEKTARAVVPGIDCDGARMWNWRDRYPRACLEVLGAIYKAEALAAKKQTYRNQLAVVILTVLAGLGGAYATYRLWGRWFPPGPPSAIVSTAVTPFQQPRVGKRRGWPFLWRGVGTASVIGGSRAYPCWGYSSEANQYFVNANRTISGVVHGWTSDCHDESYVCGQTCSTSDSGGPNGGTSTTTCTPDWCTRPVESASPLYYVNWSLRRVQDCGFHLADTVTGEVGLRIGHPLLEKKWKVKISVDRFNVTDGTDPAVMCLWDIGNH